MVARLAGGRLARWFYVSEGQMATTDHVLRTRDVGRLSQRRGLVMRVRVRGLTVPRWDLTVENGQDAHQRTRHDSLHPVPASGCPGDVEPVPRAPRDPGHRSAALRTWCYVTNVANMARRGSGSGRRGAARWRQSRARASPTPAPALDPHIKTPTAERRRVVEVRLRALCPRRLLDSANLPVPVRVYRA